MASDRVDLVDEHDRRRVLLRLLEEVPDPRRADADEHLDEVRTRDGVEGHARLTGDRAGEERLAGARRAEQQHASGDLRPHGLELRGVGEVLLDLLELLHRLVHTGDVGERRLRLVLRDDLRLRLPERHHPVAAPLGAVHDPDQDAADEEHREHDLDDRPKHLSAGLRVGRDLDARILQLLGERLLGVGGVADLVLVAVRQLADDLLVLVLELRRLDLPGGDLPLERRERQVLDRRPRADERHDEHERPEQEHQIDRGAPEDAPQRGLGRGRGKLLSNVLPAEMLRGPER
jgi:hypothetical protein